MEQLLGFEKSTKLDTDGHETDMYRLCRDPLLGNFDPEKKFAGEVIVTASHKVAGHKDYIEKQVRITRCHVRDASTCPWNNGADVIGEIRCLAVKQIYPMNFEPGVSFYHTWEPLCKAHVPSKERLEIEIEKAL